MNNHLQAAREGVDAVMRDFSEESVLITGEATYRGLDQIRSFYKDLLSGLPEGFFEAFKMIRQEIVGEVAYTYGKPSLGFLWPRIHSLFGTGSL